jgi:hypothetical protein
LTTRPGTPAFVARFDLPTTAETSCASASTDCRCIGTARLRGVLDHERTDLVRDRQRRIDVGDATARIGRHQRKHITIANACEFDCIEIDRARRKVTRAQFKSSMRDGKRDQRTGVGRHDDDAASVPSMQGGQRHHRGCRVGAFDLHGSGTEEIGSPAGQQWLLRASRPQVAPVQRQSCGRRNLVTMRATRGHRFR